MKKFLPFFIITAFFITISNAQSNSPILIRPPNTTNVVSLTTTLQWNGANDAINYEVWISTDPNFSYVITQQTLNPTDAQIPLLAGWLQLNTTYYWKVRVVNPYTSDFSSTWSFTTIENPQQGINYMINDVSGLFYNENNLTDQANILINYLVQGVNNINQNDTVQAIDNLQTFENRIQLLGNSNYLNQDQLFSLQNSCDGILDVITIQQSHFILPSANKNDAHSFSLTQNYPNPFNPSTNIEFSIPEKLFVTLKIYDILGKEVATLINKELNAGSYISIWNASQFSSGVYFYRLIAGKYIQTKKLVLNK